jgi:Universal stress protein family
MNKFQRLFVAIDFSPGSDEALRQAYERAASTGAQLACATSFPTSFAAICCFHILAELPH